MDWNARYAEPGYAYGEQPNDFLVEHADLIPQGRVLCLAEGQGRNAVYLAKLGYQVTGVDASLEGINKARQLAEQHGVEVEFIHADLADFTIAPGYWQGIVSIFCHLPAQLRHEVHDAVQAGLAAGGVLLLEAYTPAQLALATGGPRDTAMCMTLEGLRDELSGLDWQLGRELERDVIEGKYHHGRGAVVQVIARKT